MKTIGVFDSGIGGLAMINAIKKEIPNVHVIHRDDKENLPYGDKSKEQLLKLVLPKLREMQDEGADVIVVACNTVSTNIIQEIRDQISLPIVAMEPMIKPAANETKSKTIGVCATPATLSSDGYARLKNSFAKGLRVVEPDCSQWSKMIEEDKVDRKHIKEAVEEMLGQGVDVIVLGCTHYHWIEDLIKEIAGNRAQVLQPETPVIEQLRRVLSRLS